jgi:hypothetical protein
MPEIIEIRWWSKREDKNVHEGEMERGGREREMERIEKRTREDIHVQSKHIQIE